MLFLLGVLCTVFSASAAEDATDEGPIPGATPPPPTVNPGTEISYDDGSMESPWTATSTGIMYDLMLAVQFTPPFTPALLTDLIFYIDDWVPAEPLMVHVLDSSKADMITPFAVTPDLGAWNIVDLSPYCIVVTEDFFLGLEHTVAYTSALGLDEDSNAGRSWTYIATDGWRLLPSSGVYSGNWMIRAVVDEVPPHVIPEYPMGTILGAISMFALLLSFTFVRKRKWIDGNL